MTNKGMEGNSFAQVLVSTMFPEKRDNEIHEPRSGNLSSPLNSAIIIKTTGRNCLIRIKRLNTKDPLV